MNEKEKYAEMLDIPVSTSSITYKPSKKRKRKTEKENVKETLIDKINEKVLKAPPIPVEDGKVETAPVPDTEKAEIKEEIKQTEVNGEINITSTVVKKKPKKFPFKITAIGVELCIICFLVVTILLTSALMPNSGINSFFTEAFNKESEYGTNFTEFSPTFSTISANDVTEDKGVMTIKNQSNLYSPENGIVESVNIDGNGLYSIVIKHGSNFKTVISGADYCYVEEGNKVYTTIPVGYVREKDITVCFTDGENKVITEDVEASFSLWG